MFLLPYINNYDSGLVNSVPAVPAKAGEVGKNGSNPNYTRKIV